MKNKPILFFDNVHRDSNKCVHCIYCINADLCNPNLCLDFIKVKNPHHFKVVIDRFGILAQF